MRNHFTAVRRPLSRIAAFGLLPAVSLLSNLVVLPILSARFGQPGWSSVLLGQSIGAAASLLCGLSWSLEGPHAVASVGPEERADLYAQSVRQRAVAVAILTPPVVALCLLARPSMPLVCVLSAIAITLNALGPGWYFTGVSQPSRSLVAEGGPRLVVNLVSIGLVVFLPLWTYPAALIAGILATLLIASRLVRHDARRAGSGYTADRPRARARSRAPVLAVTARGADAGYSYLCAPLVALVAPRAYPLFAAVDRMGQSLLNVMATITQGLTAWIGEAGLGVQRRRVYGAVVLAFGFALLSHLVLLITTPLLLRFLFAGTVKVDATIAFLAATVISGGFLTRALFFVLLIPLGLAPTAYCLMIVTACVGLPLVGAAAGIAGSVAALTVVAAVPWVLVTAQLAAGWTRLHKLKTTSQDRVVAAS
jgi:hypothetical protein